MSHAGTHLDLFSGIGGFALAAQWAGFRTIAFSEVEPYACRVLAERFPGVPNVGDVRQRANFARFAGRVDVLTGGFPCQPWSEAGQRRGQNDDRHLWPAMCDVIETVRPAWVIGENVPGFISVGLDVALSDLARLGYAAQPFVVPACAVGADHLRDRVWIIAHIDGQRELQPSGSQFEVGGRSRDRAQSPAPDAVCAGLQGGGQYRISAQAQKEREPTFAAGDFPRREAYPDLLREVHGVSARPHRIKALGNSIVPQVAEQFFRFIAQI